MAEKIFTITAESGLHARPATQLVHAAGGFQSEVQLVFKGRSVNLKSIMGVMSLGIPQGSEIKIIADGSDAEEALGKIEEVLKTSGLGE